MVNFHNVFQDSPTAKSKGHSFILNICAWSPFECKTENLACLTPDLTNTETVYFATLFAPHYCSVMLVASNILIELDLYNLVSVRVRSIPPLVIGGKFILVSLPPQRTAAWAPRIS